MFVIKTPLTVLISILIGSITTVDINTEDSVKVTHLSIPRYAVAGNDVKFNCQFKLYGKEHMLYTVSWWRDTEQFFLYKANGTNKKLPFDLKGITVSLEESSKEMIVLKNVSKDTSGVYTCEIMGEGPAFKADTKVGNLTVIVPPETILIEQTGNPKKDTYNLSDTIRMKCTVIGMYPTPKIHWLINDKDVTEPSRPLPEERYSESRQPHRRIVTSTIAFEAGKFFERHVANIACMASIHGQSFLSTVTDIYLDPSTAFHLYSSSERTYLSCVGAVVVLSVNLCILIALFKSAFIRHFC